MSSCDIPNADKIEAAFNKAVDRSKYTEEQLAIMDAQRKESLAKIRAQEKNDQCLPPENNEHQNQSTEQNDTPSDSTETGETQDWNTEENPQSDTESWSSQTWAEEQKGIMDKFKDWDYKWAFKDIGEIIKKFFSSIWGKLWKLWDSIWEWFNKIFNPKEAAKAALKWALNEEQRNEFSKKMITWVDGLLPFEMSKAKKDKLNWMITVDYLEKKLTWEEYDALMNKGDAGPLEKWKLMYSIMSDLYTPQELAVETQKARVGTTISSLKKVYNVDINSEQLEKVTTILNEEYNVDFYKARIEETKADWNIFWAKEFLLSVGNEVWNIGNVFWELISEGIIWVWDIYVLVTDPLSETFSVMVDWNFGGENKATEVITWLTLGAINSLEWSTDMDQAIRIALQQKIYMAAAWVALTSLSAASAATLMGVDWINAVRWASNPDAPSFTRDKVAAKFNSNVHNSAERLEKYARLMEGAGWSTHLITALKETAASYKGLAGWDTTKVTEAVKSLKDLLAHDDIKLGVKWNLSPEKVTTYKAIKDLLKHAELNEKLALSWTAAEWKNFVTNNIKHKLRMTEVPNLWNKIVANFSNAQEYNSFKMSLQNAPAWVLGMLSKIWFVALIAWANEASDKDILLEYAALEVPAIWIPLMILEINSPWDDPTRILNADNLADVGILYWLHAANATLWLKSYGSSKRWWANAISWWLSDVFYWTHETLKSLQSDKVAMNAAWWSGQLKGSLEWAKWYLSELKSKNRYEFALNVAQVAWVVISSMYLLNWDDWTEDLHEKWILAENWLIDIDKLSDFDSPFNEEIDKNRIRLSMEEIHALNRPQIINYLSYKYGIDNFEVEDDGFEIDITIKWQEEFSKSDLIATIYSELGWFDSWIQNYTFNVKKEETA